MMTEKRCAFCGEWEDWISLPQIKGYEDLAYCNLVVHSFKQRTEELPRHAKFHAQIAVTLMRYCPKCGKPIQTAEQKGDKAPKSTAAIIRNDERGDGG